jgi:hypothetical protein
MNLLHFQIVGRKAHLYMSTFIYEFSPFSNSWKEGSFIYEFIPPKIYNHKHKNK